MNNSNFITFDIQKYWKPVKKYGNFDFTHEYRILVPLNEGAEERMYRYQLYDEKGVSTEFMCLEFREDTYYIMDDFFFIPFNNRFELIITAEEEEVIYTDQLDDAKELVKSILDNTDDAAVTDFGNILLKMIITAQEHNTVVGFYF